MGEGWLDPMVGGTEEREFGMCKGVAGVLEGGRGCSTEGKER